MAVCLGLSAVVVPKKGNRLFEQKQAVLSVIASHFFGEFMSNKATKAKRKALPGVSADALIEAGLLDPFFHLQDPVDIAYEKFLRRFPSPTPKQSDRRTADGAHGAGEKGGE